MDGGGFPSWLLGRPGVLRSTDPRYTRAWKAWFASVLPRVARWQLGGARSGTVIALQIENEFSASGAGPDAYMRDLYATARADGITGADPPQRPEPRLQLRAAFATSSTSTASTPTRTASPAARAWGKATFARARPASRRATAVGPALADLHPGDPGRRASTSPATTGERTTQRLYRALAGYGTAQDVTLLGQGTTMINRYMAFGGTTWGYLPFPHAGHELRLRGAGARVDRAWARASTSCGG